MIKLFLVVFSLLPLSQQIFTGLRPDGRIISGETAPQGMFPFAASLYIRTRLGNYHCGGALLSDLWVLSGAQCVDEALNITVTVGSTKLDGDDEYRQVIPHQRYVMHSSYNPETLENDIALVHLQHSVQFGFTTATVSVYDVELEDNDQVIALGWGATRDKGPEYTNELEWVNLNVISNGECEKTYGGQVKQSMICAKGEYIEGICRGDTGGPLVHHIRGSYYRIVGITSFMSGKGCETDHPSGFTRVHHYTKWLEDTTGIPV